VLAPLIGALLALYFIRRYELTEAGAYQIKDELSRRRARAAVDVLPASQP